MSTAFFKEPSILAHPTGRLINKHPPYKVEVEMEKILFQAQQANKILEINGQPERLDLSDRFCKRAKEVGVKMVVSTDADNILQLQNMKYAVDQASRG